MTSRKASAHRPLDEAIADRLAIALKDQRATVRLTQEQVAASSHVSVQLIRRLEAGTSNPTLGTLDSIASALSTTMSALLKKSGA